MEQTSKILIVDDDLKIIKALKRILNHNGYDIYSATNPNAAVEIINKEDIHLIVCDEKMPGMTGIDLLKYIRDVSPSTVRILITAYSDYNVAVEAINKGRIFHYITKPWDNCELIRIVEEGLQSRQNDLVFLKCNNVNYLSGKVDTIHQMMNSFRYKKRIIPVWDCDDIVLIETSEINYFEAVNGEVAVVTRKGIYKSAESLNHWERELAYANFFRCHRGYIVNIERIERISPWFNGCCNLKLKEMRESIPVSRSALKRLKQLVGI